MRNYSDLVTEIDLVKEQIRVTGRELEYWYGIDEEGEGVPLGGTGSHKYGANASVIQASRIQKTLDILNGKLRSLEYAKIRQDILLEQLEGLEYKIAYNRIVHNMTHKEVADKLGFTEQYIRRKWAEMKSNKEATDSLENV